MANDAALAQRLQRSAILALGASYVEIEGVDASVGTLQTKAGRAQMAKLLSEAGCVPLQQWQLQGDFAPPFIMRQGGLQSHPLHDIRSDDELVTQPV